MIDTFLNSSKKKKNKYRPLEDDDEKSDVDDSIGKINDTSEQHAREPSPELARISALITRPPKQKSSNKRKKNAFLSKKHPYLFLSIKKFCISHSLVKFIQISIFFY